MAIITFNSNISSNNLVELDSDAVQSNLVESDSKEFYSISGNVYFAIYNIPLENITLDLYDESHNFIQSTKSINSNTLNGYFSFINIPSGKYYLEVNQKDIIPIAYYSYNLYFDKIKIPIELTEDITDLFIKI